MTRSLFPAAVLLLAGPALAQEVPEPARRDLWCAVAFEYVVGDLPADATGRQQQLIPRFSEGAQRLLERAASAYRRAGYNEESFAARREALAEEIAAQLSGEAEVPYSAEDCAALLDAG